MTSRQLAEHPRGLGFTPEPRGLLTSELWLPHITQPWAVSEFMWYHLERRLAWGGLGV